jgi:hypothetical protein
LIVAGVLAAFNVYASFAETAVYPFASLVAGYLFPTGIFMLITDIDYEVIRDKRAPAVAGMAMVGFGIVGVMLALIGNLLFFGRLF